MRVVLIGLGSIGRKHVKVIRELNPTTEIFALRSGEGSPVEEGITNIYGFTEIPGNIDFFLIANPTIFHQEAIQNLLPYRKPLFIEKPVLSELNKKSFELLKEIIHKNIFTYVGCPLRFHPCIKFLKNELENKQLRLNEVNIYCGSYLPDWRPGRNFREIYSARPELGGGVHLDLIHEIDYTYFLFGKPKTVSSTFSSKSSLAIEAIDYAHYQLEYEHFQASITLNYYRPIPKRNIELVFKESIWNVDLIASTITDEKGNIIFSEQTDQQSLLRHQMSAFFVALKDQKLSPNSFEEATEVLKICLNQLP